MSSENIINFNGKKIDWNLLKGEIHKNEKLSQGIFNTLFSKIDVSADGIIDETELSIFKSKFSHEVLADKNVTENELKKILKENYNIDEINSSEAFDFMIEFGNSTHSIITNDTSSEPINNQLNFVNGKISNVIIDASGAGISHKPYIGEIRLPKGVQAHQNDEMPKIIFMTLPVNYNGAVTKLTYNSETDLYESKMKDMQFKLEVKDGKTYLTAVKDAELTKIRNDNLGEIRRKKPVSPTPTPTPTPKPKPQPPKNSGININGKIEAFKQNGKADCYLLASLISLSNNPTTAKIIKNNIKKNADGSVTVTFPGAKAIRQKYKEQGKQCRITGSYRISKEVFERARNSGKYSTGDDDVLCFELAFKQYRKEVEANNKLHNIRSSVGRNNAGSFISGDKNDILNYGLADDAIFVLTNKMGVSRTDITNANKSIPAKQIKSQHSISSVDTSFQREWTLSLRKSIELIQNNPNKYIATVCFDVVQGDNRGGHILSIKKVDNNYVYLINPWDSTKVFKFKKEYFINKAQEITIVNVNQERTELPSNFF